MTHSIHWLITSAVFFLLEAFGIPGIGFLFAGLGAAIAAALLSAGLIAEDNLILQFAVFALFTGASAVLLWRKLKAWRVNPNAPHYSNIVGTEATVLGNGLSGHHVGEVRWSATIMRARLADATLTLPAGTLIKIAAVEGNVLVVVPK